MDSLSITPRNAATVAANEGHARSRFVDALAYRWKATSLVFALTGLVSWFALSYLNHSQWALVERAEGMNSALNHTATQPDIPLSGTPPKVPALNSPASTSVPAGVSGVSTSAVSSPASSTPGSRPPGTVDGTSISTVADTARKSEKWLGEAIVREEIRHNEIQAELDKLAATPEGDESGERNQQTAAAASASAVSTARAEKLLDASGPRSQVEAARSLLAKLQESYTDAHPDVIAAKQRLREVQQRLNAVVEANQAISERNAAGEAEAKQAEKALTANQAGQAATETAHHTEELVIEMAAMDTQMQSDRARLARLQKLERESDFTAVQTPPTPVSDMPEAAASSSPSAATSTVDAKIPAGPGFQAAFLTALVQPFSQSSILLLCLVTALLGSAVYLLLAEMLDHSVKHGRMLRRSLPPGVIYAGSIPRMLS